MSEIICGVDGSHIMDSFQCASKITPKCARLLPFQIFVICADALVHFSQRDRSSAFVKFQIKDSSLSKISKYLSDDSNFKTLLRSSFEDFDDPTNCIERFMPLN